MEQWSSKLSQQMYYENHDFCRKQVSTKSWFDFMLLQNTHRYGYDSIGNQEKMWNKTYKKKKATKQVMGEKVKFTIMWFEQILKFGWKNNNRLQKIFTRAYKSKSLCGCDIS